MAERLHTRLARAVNDGDDELATKLRKKIDDAPPRPGLSEHMLATLKRPDHTCCCACRGS